MTRMESFRYLVAGILITGGIVIAAVLVASLAIGWLGLDDDPNDLGSVWPAVERCAVVMPEDLDR